MLSLKSVNSADEVRGWHRKLLAKLPEGRKGEGGAGADDGGAGLAWVVEPKFDGLAVSLLYGRDGLLQRVGRVTVYLEAGWIGNATRSNMKKVSYSSSSLDPLPPQAATRGDGSVGEDVTHNAPSITGLPLDIGPLDVGSSGRGKSVRTAEGGSTAPAIEVRGEVYMRQLDLVKVIWCFQPPPFSHP